MLFEHVGVFTDARAEAVRRRPCQPRCVTERIEYDQGTPMAKAIAFDRLLDAFAMVLFGGRVPGGGVGGR